MFPHFENIIINDFKNICRTCMLTCDIKFFQDTVISDVFFKLTNLQFETNDEFPEQICLKCFEKINEIHYFKFECLRAHSILTKCLNNLRLNKEEANTNTQKNIELVEVERISTIDVINNELKLNQIGMNEDEISNTCELNEDQNINCSEDDMKKICKTCMGTCDIKFVLDSALLDVFHKLTQIQFETNDEVPQQVCSKCYEKIKEIHEFAFQCKRINSTLTECSNTSKKIQLKEIATDDIVNVELKSQEDRLTGNKIPDTSKLNKDRHSDDRLYLPTRLKNSGERIYKCDQCPKSFVRSCQFKFHVFNHSSERVHKCDICLKSFALLDSLKMHMRFHSSERPYKCDQCSKSYVKLGDLKVHKRTHSGERPYKCDQCSKSFSVFSILKNHKRVHSGERPYKCEQCPKSFSVSCNLKTHMRTHTGECPYKCDQCPKSFSQLENLKKHLFVHSGERPHKCDQCSKSFAQSRDLISHLIIHSGERPFKCDQCSKSFARLDGLREHKRRHSDERPYKCDLCPKSFVKSCNLKNHIRRHNGERPFKCDQCSKSFPSFCDLKKHLRVHTGERPYKCDLCSKLFSTTSNLGKHMRRHKN